MHGRISNSSSPTKDTGKRQRPRRKRDLALRSALAIGGVLLIAVVLLTVLAAPASACDNKVTLTGTVTGDGGAALRGVHVQVLSGDTVVARAVTNRAGHYRARVAPGTYDLKFEAKTYGVITDTAVVISDTGTTQDAALVRLPVLTGTVTGEGGAPVRCAAVKIMNGSTVVARGMTNWKGQYKVWVATGTYDVKICAWTYEQFVATGVSVTGPSTTLDAALIRMPVLTGTVTGDGGVALRGVKVKIKNGSAVVACAKTDRNGVYTVYVAAGTYDVTFWRWGYAPLTDTGVVTAPPSTTLDATLTPAA